MERELVPVYGLDSKYILGLEDAVLQPQKGCREGRHTCSGHVKIDLGSQTSSFEKNIISLLVFGPFDKIESMVQLRISQAVEIQGKLLFMLGKKC